MDSLLKVLVFLLCESNCNYSYDVTEKEPLQQTLVCMSKCAVSGMGLDTTAKMTGRECNQGGDQDELT